MKRIRSGTRRLALPLALAGLVLVVPAAQAATRPATFSFDLVPSGTAAACLPHARGEVRLTSHGSNQQMDVRVSGLPVNNTFTVFVIQVPHGPFGLAWYQGDIVTDQEGNGHGRFVGIFSDAPLARADVERAVVVRGSARRLALPGTGQHRLEVHIHQCELE